MSSLVRPLAIVLLLGTALLAAGAAMHPVLAGSAADHLRIIAATTHWRAMHLAMLAGAALIVAGIWVRLPGAGATGVAAVGASLAIIAIGEAVNALNIAYMAGSGWHMAVLFARGHAEVAPIYDATHPIGLVAARFGNLIVALGALALGWTEWRDPARPRWLAVLAWLAGVGGLIGVLFFSEASPLALAAVALLCGWQTVTAVRALARGT